MAINRFDTPAQAQFINTYVPIPFEQMLRAGQAKQKRFDETAAAVDQSIAAAEQLNAIPDSVDEAYISNVKQTMFDIRDKYADKDLSDTMVRRQLNNEINTKLDKDRIRRIQESYAGWQGYQKQKAAMQARGQKVYGDVDFRGYNTGRTGEGEIFTGLPVMDLGAQAEKAIDDFLTRPEQDYREVKLGSGRMGIEHYRDLNKIRDLIDAESGELQENPAIRQLMEKRGLDEAGFKQFLREVAPSYIDKKLTSTYAAPEPDTGSGNDFDYLMGQGVYGRETLETGDAKARQIKRETRNIENQISGLPAGSEERIELEQVLEDRKRVEQQIQNKINPVFSEQRDKEVKGLLNTLVTEGGFRNEKEAKKAMTMAIKSPNFLKEALIELGIDFTKTIPTRVQNILLGLGKVAASPFSATFSLFDKEVGEDMVNLDFDSFKKKFKEYQSDLPDYKEIPESTPKIKSSVLKTLRELNKINKAEGEAFDEELMNSELNVTVSSPYALTSSVTDSKGLLWDMDGLPSGAMKVFTNTFSSPQNYNILSIDGKDVKDKTKQQLIGNEVIDMETSLNISDETDFNPEVVLVTKDDNDDYHRIKVRYQEDSQINALAKSYYSQGDDHTAYKLLNKELAKAVSKQKFTDENKQVMLVNPFTKQPLMPYNIRRKGTGFVVENPYRLQDSVEVSTRKELIDVLYGKTTSAMRLLHSRK